ncbi:hypothetical protein M434DRAFT_29974 [Hypoxylon sp. CO27-5]|nr:hypothetical protein M434DRAFT_29974 [Hypoxylon sp. CO27-5]
MGRRKNKSRRPKTHPNNKPGPRNVRFDDDHIMRDAPQPSAKNRHPYNAKGGKNKPFPSHDRGAAPWHGGNKPNNNRSFSGPPHQQQQQQQHNNNRGQGRRNNHHPNSHNTNNGPNPRNRKANRGGPHNTLGDDNVNPSDLPLPFASSPAPHSKNNTRFCTECSSVRRANLRFRNWAHGALRQCGERFLAWAEEAGVGFEAADEMDWQPEPVVRVVILGPEFENQNQQEQQQHQIQQQQQQYWLQQQQHQLNVGPIGPLPVPGPWCWPPWCDCCNRCARDPTLWPALHLPECTMPEVPKAADLLPPGPECCAAIPTAGPVSGFGLSAGNGSGSAGGSGGAFSVGEREPSPCPECEVIDRPTFSLPLKIPTRGPMETPATKSTCGPTLRTGMRRSSSDGCMFPSCCV